MDGFLYYRVPTSSLFQFAQLAINSNAQHPSHHRGSRQTAVSSSPFLLNQFELRFVVHSSITAALPASSSPFPLPLVDVICAYCLVHSFVSGEASGVYSLYSGDGDLITAVETPHSDTASSVTCLPNTDTIVTAARDGNIYLFKQQHDDAASAAAQQPASASAAAASHQWRRVGEIAHRHEVHSLCWCIVRNPLYEPSSSQSSSSAGSHIVAILVGSSSPTLDVYDPVTTRLLHQLPGHTAKVSAMAVLPPSASTSTSLSSQSSSSSSQAQAVGSRIVSCSWDGDCRLWDLERLECEAVLRGGGAALTCVASTGRGGVVAGDVKGALRQWSITELLRAASAAPAGREAEKSAGASSSSSIASISFASQSAFSPNVFSFPHPPPSHPATVLPAVPATLPFPSMSSSPLRALLSVNAASSSSSYSQHLFTGSDDGLRLYTHSAAGSWRYRCRLRDGGEDDRVYCLLALSDWRLAAGMGGKRICVWNIERLLAERETAAAAAEAERAEAGADRGRVLTVEQGDCGVQLERRISGLSRSVRCLALRQQVDLS